MINNEPIQDKIKTLQIVKQWTETELVSLGVPTVLPTIAPPTGNEESFLRNENSICNLLIANIAKTLKFEGPQRELLAYVVKVAQELDGFRQQHVSLA